MWFLFPGSRRPKCYTGLQLKWLSNYHSIRLSNVATKYFIGFIGTLQSASLSPMSTFFYYVCHFRYITWHILNNWRATKLKYSKNAFDVYTCRFNIWPTLYTFLSFGMDLRHNKLFGKILSDSIYSFINLSIKQTKNLKYVYWY